MQERDLKIAKLIYRSWHRGCKETDILMGDFAKAELSNMTNEEINLYETFCEESDHDIYKWLTGDLEYPEKYKIFIDGIKEFMLNSKKSKPNSN